MAPRYLLMWTHFIYCVMLVRELSVKGPKGPGVAYLRFLLSLGKRGCRPCLAENGVVLGASRQRRFFRGIGSSLA